MAYNVKSIVTFIFLISFLCNLHSKDNFKVLKIDNQSPGYIKLDRVAYLLDHYGKPVLADKMDFGTNSFKLLKNGLWVHLVIDNYYLYDSTLNIID